MLKKNQKNRELFVGCILVLFIALSILYIGIMSKKNTDDKKENKVTISDVFNSIKDNYTINVTKELNAQSVQVKIQCDKDICIYTSDLFPDKEIMTYNDKWYTVTNTSEYNKDNLKETNNEILEKSFNKQYYDLELIKSIIEVSNRESEKDSKIKSTVTLERYLKEYNYLYSKIDKTDKEVNIPILLDLTNYNIKSITIDYKDIDNYFNKTNYDKLSYKIEIKNINKNDFNTIREFFNTNK